MEIISTNSSVARGTIIGGHELGDQIGKGRFSTVWSCCRDIIVAKVYRSGSTHMREWQREVKVLDAIGTSDYIIGYHGTVAHVALNTRGDPIIHPCIMLSRRGCSLSNFMRYLEEVDEDMIGLPTVMVKSIMREVLSGLAHLHHHGVIHGDIKPGNILLNLPEEEITPDNAHVVIADLGSSIFASSEKRKPVGTTGYMAPEVIVERHFDYSADIWSAFTMCFKLISGDLLFDIFAECDIIYGEDIDIDAIDLSKRLEECTMSVDEKADDSWLNMEDKRDESNDETDDCDDSNNSSDDNSDSGDSEDDLDENTINYVNLMLIAKVIGYPPKEFICDDGKVRIYYNRHGRLMYNPDIVPTNITHLLANNYEMSEEESSEIAEFLLAGLKYMPEDRVTAVESLKLDWLKIENA